MRLTEEQSLWCKAHTDEAIALLKTLGRIPAPSHHEDARVAFLTETLSRMGFEVRTDEAKNVLLPFGDLSGEVSVVMAHTDIVFPDTEELPMREEDGRLYAPGIGDDTANLVNLLMAARYLKENGIAPKHGLLVVANSCEEGLGNLKGSKQIVRDYASVMRELVSLDGNTGAVVTRAVGSHRYRVTMRAQGGHSYGAFGNTNAIERMARLICALYGKEVPTKAKTTYNVGVIEGGTTVNSIAAECTMLYEYRSEDRECLSEMEAFLNATVARFTDMGYDISLERIGDRPCGGDVDEEKETDLKQAFCGILREITGEEPDTDIAMSTDCNSALAAGIPAVCIGSVNGEGAHTRGEWVDLSSMENGLRIALATLLYCSR